MQPFEQYKYYKPAPIACLGEVPTHWNTALLGYLFGENKEKNTGNIEATILSLSYGKVILKKGKENFGLLPAAYDTYQIINPGYLVFRFTDMQNDHVSLRVGLAQNRGIITSAYVGLKPRKELSSKYYYYLFHTLDILKFYYSFGGGVRQSLDFKGMRRVPLPLPPLAEQTAIANFLDRKTTQIDEYVALKQKTIALLQEQKTAIINRAVTQGLNPAAPMKDSGIEWLGKIPAHWEVKRLAVMGRFSKGGGFSKADLTNEGQTAILYGDIYTKYQFSIRQGARKISIETSKKSVEIKRGDLLFTGSGETIEDIGKCVVYDNQESAFAGGDVIIFRQTENNSTFLSYFLNTDGAKHEKAKMAKGEIIVHIYASKLRNLYVTIPPLAEQHQIVAHIEQTAAKIEQAIAQAQQQIDLIKEYRESLISQAVTGKIRVIDNEKLSMNNYQ